MKPKNRADEVMEKLQDFLNEHRAELLVQEQGTGLTVKCEAVLSEPVFFPADTVYTRKGTHRWTGKKWAKPVR